MRPPFNFDEPPSRQKYFDEESYCFGLWFVFGEYPDGCVDISDANLHGDMFTHVPKEKAEALIAARREFLDKVWAIWKGE